MPAKLFSMAFSFLYVLYRAALYCIPFLFDVFTVTLFCNQLPRVVMFSAWHLLGIFFVNAFLARTINQQCLGIFYGFLLVIPILMLALAIILSYHQSDEQREFEGVTAYSCTVFYFILAVWVTVYTFRIVYTSFEELP